MSDLFVFNAEDGYALLGIYAGTDEATVFYIDAGGKRRAAPDDCVVVRRDDDPPRQPISG